MNGIHLAHLSYTYGLNGLRMPKDQDWWVNLIDVDRIAEDATAARELGAEFIVVSLHWGTEYQPKPDAYQRRIARSIADRGSVDLLIGHHAHVVQPVDRIGALWVAYGLGNFLSGQRGFSTRDGVILNVKIGDGPGGVAVQGVTYTPTWVDRNTMQVVTVADRLAPGLDRWDRSTLRQSWSRTVKAPRSDGCRPPRSSARPVCSQWRLGRTFGRGVKGCLVAGRHGRCLMTSDLLLSGEGRGRVAHAGKVKSLAER